MKNKIIIIAVLLTTIFANAQTSLKVYNEFSFYEKKVFETINSSNNLHYKETYSETTIFQPTFALQWKCKKKKNLHQIEINRFKINSIGNLYKIWLDSQSVSNMTNGNKIIGLPIKVAFS